MNSPEQYIEMAAARKKTEEKRSPRDPEKARAAFESRFKVLTASTQEHLTAYKTKVADGSFDDQEDETAGTGDARKREMQTSITRNVERLERMKATLESGGDFSPTATAIEAEYAQERIVLDIEDKLQEFLDFYKTTKVDIPPDFEERVREIFERNIEEIQKAVEENGFDDMLLVPGGLSLPDLSQKMKMENGYYDYIKEQKTVADLNGIPLVTVGADTDRIILVHKAQNLADHPELKKTLGKKAQDLAVEESLSLDDYLVFQKKYHQGTGKHLDENGWTWLLKTKSGARFVSGRWNRDDHELGVGASDAGLSFPYLGCRPSRYFI